MGEFHATRVCADLVISAACLAITSIFVESAGAAFASSRMSRRR
jgi:hypothetical protein